MMRALVGVVALGVATAHAQPGAQPPVYAPPPQAYVPLLPEEAALLARGPISDGQHIGGTLLALGFGFGVGQAVQGRWSDTGWIFTLGDSASMTLAFYGMISALSGCPDDGSFCDGNRGLGAFVVGMIGFGVFRIWETADAIAGPISHNRKFEALQYRLQGGWTPAYSLYLAPTLDAQSRVAGLSLRF